MKQNSTVMRPTGDGNENISNGKSILRRFRLKSNRLDKKRGVCPTETPLNTITTTEDQSRWGRAYNALKESEPQIVVAYENLLSEALERTKPNVSISRQDSLHVIAELGLEHARHKQVRVTMLGTEIILQEQVRHAATMASRIENWVAQAISGTPYASLMWAGVSLVLPLLTNAPAEEMATQEGFTYVTGEMAYYNSMEEVLLTDDLAPRNRLELERRLIQLYQLVLAFQIRCILRFYRSRTKNYLRDTFQYDGWAGQLEAIRTADGEFITKTNLSLAGDSRNALRTLVAHAKATHETLQELLQNPPPPSPQSPSPSTTFTLRRNVTQQHIATGGWGMQNIVNGNHTAQNMYMGSVTNF